MFVAVIGAALLVACSGAALPPVPRLVTRTHQSMGTDVRVSVWTGDEAAAGPAMAAVFAEFDRLDARLSVWQPDSDVRRINAAAGMAPVAVSRDTREVLRRAHQLSEWTAGKFDITFGALADVWKFDQDQDDRVPTPAEVAARLPLVDYRTVAVDESAGTVFVSRRGARIHLGGIGKGYAVDQAVAILRQHGWQDFLVQAGGDLFVAGQPGPEPWRLGIQDPRGRVNDSFATIALRDRTFSTSGDYERYFLRDGQRYHHILDPATGQPARAAVSVTIVADTATMAEGLTKGVFILGAEQGMALVERLPNVGAVMVTADNRVLISSRLRDQVHVLHPPTNTRP